MNKWTIEQRFIGNAVLKSPQLCIYMQCSPQWFDLLYKNSITADAAAVAVG